MHLLVLFALIKLLGHDALQLVELTLHGAHSIDGLLAVYAYIGVNAALCWFFRAGGKHGPADVQDPSELR